MTQAVARAIDPALWRQANRTLVAKAISEFSFEELLQPAPLQSHDLWEVSLSDRVSYRFAGRRRIWGQLSIEPDTLLRIEGEQAAPVVDAAGFFLDAAGKLGASPATLSTYIKEIHNTLMADMEILARRTGLDADALSQLPDVGLQRFLDGHPKAPANKGRLGWGQSEFELYGPEFGATTQLFYIAAARNVCTLSLSDDATEAGLLEQAMGEAERDRLMETLHALGGSRETHVILPVHPWQWQAMLQSHYAGEIAAGRLIPLGQFGDAYAPQQSLRTLANVSRPDGLHVKLPLTILNTSAWRGVPGKYMAIGPDLSEWLADKARADRELAHVTVLREVAGAFYPHPIYANLPGAPYQYQEMLGVIWRESPDKGLAPDVRPMMMGALAQTDAGGRSIASALIARSGLTPVAWLTAMFSTVTVPLYHFMCRYGVGFIAHGQNVTVLLQGDTPFGVAVKDFQGDLDLVDEDFPELEDLAPLARRILKRRPAAHLLQHLQTGHITSALRFLSQTLAEEGVCSEEAFYRLLADALQDYQQRHPELSHRFGMFDLFQTHAPRIAINRVRFAIGYGDASERPLPDLGTPLLNPLATARHAPDAHHQRVPDKTIRSLAS